MTFEASEDRLLVAVASVHSGGDATVETSFSNSMLTDSQETDETASGVVHFGRSQNHPATVFESDEYPVWHAGEELNVHVDNAGGSSVLVLTLIWYIPVGDFHRSRLRNS